MRCPVCRVENATGPQCRRCRADLSLLFALEDQRASLVAEAQAAMVRADGLAAVRLAESAQELRDDMDVRRLLALGHLLRHDYAAALHFYATGLPVPVPQS